MTTETPPPSDSPTRRPPIAGLAIAVVVVVGLVGVALASGGVGTPTTATGSGAPSAASSPGPTLAGTPTPAPPTPTPWPTPVFEPPLVASALTGELVTEDAAMRHPIAVMIDDQAGARPQSGFNAASIVWQAPAEGGIPRYMLIFQDQIPAKVGPVRSSREYFIEWAAEWRAMYVHAGGSPQALQTLARYGQGQWVWNADDFRWEGRYLFRVDHVTVKGGPTYPLVAPHNVYTDGDHLRKLAARIGAVDGSLQPAWTFGTSALPFARAVGTRITVAYPYEAIQYRYDPGTNTYRRYIRAPWGGAFKVQIDAGDGQPVAPTNVVILKMAFGLLNDGHPQKHRLEARNVGRGVAWISSNGITVKGTWRKASATAPTLLFGPDGQPIALNPGQTFVQVMKLEDTVTIRAGVIPAPPPLKPFDLLPM